jgi:hypothetical protein
MFAGKDRPPVQFRMANVEHDVGQPILFTLTPGDKQSDGLLRMACPDRRANLSR